MWGADDKGKIHEVLAGGRFGVTLDNEHKVLAYTAGMTRRLSRVSPGSADPGYLGRVVISRRSPYIGEAHVACDGN